MFGRLIASQIASASLASFLLLFTYGFTNGCDQLHRKTMRLQGSRPMVRAAACFHTDLATWLNRLEENLEPVGPRQLSAPYNPLVTIDPMNLED